jgi:AcrR family transcriptional regulator
MAKIINHLFGSNKKQHLQVRSRLVSTSPKLVLIKPANEIEVEDVAEHAQVSRGTFYKCFRSVNDLLNVSAKQAGRELMAPIVLAGSSIPDVSVRLATKTRMALRLLTRMPLLGRLMLNVEWPFKDAQHKGYQDIKKDIAQGIEQGCFTDMPLEIATNLVINTLRGAVQEMLASPQTQEYEDQVIYHLLLSLGVNAEAADEISKTALEQLPDLPKRGLVGKILKLVA